MKVLGRVGVVLAVLGGCTPAPQQGSGLDVALPGAVQQAALAEDVRVRGTLYLLRAPCPAAGREEGAERLGNKDTQEANGNRTLTFEVSVSNAELLRWSAQGATVCARVVYEATWPDDDPAGGGYPGWRRKAPPQAWLRLAHQDSAKTSVWSRTRDVELELLPLEDGTGPGDQSVYDPDQDGIPTLRELQLGLRPLDADSLEPPVPLVRLPGVRFAFGSAAADALASEGPPVPIQVGALEVDPVEVTNRQYRACAGRRSPDGGALCSVPGGDGGVPGEGWLLRSQELLPVVGLSHAQAQDLCRARGMRLPSEAEWERLARVSGTDGQAPWEYPWPPELDEPKLDSAQHNACELGRFMLYPASFTPTFCWGGSAEETPGVGPVLDADGGAARAHINGLGDLAGNAAEWTADPYVATLHEDTDAGLPWPVATDPLGVFTTKGGSYLSGLRFVRATARTPVDSRRATPAVLAALGVRCVRPVP